MLGIDAGACLILLFLLSNIIGYVLLLNFVVPLEIAAYSWCKYTRHLP